MDQSSTTKQSLNQSKGCWSDWVVDAVQELGASQEALAAARLGLQERDFLVLAHERSEDALASHALDLTARLDAACGDVRALADRCAPARMLLVAQSPSAGS